MKYPFLPVVAAAALLLAPACAVGSDEKPELKTDTSPVAEKAPSGVVTSYAEAIQPVQKAVVSVYSAKVVRQRVNPLLRQFFGDQVPNERESREEGLGSGVIVSANGFILTNNHVVEGADEINVQLSNGEEHKAKVIGTDPKTDVAVIKIEAKNLPIVTLADSDQLRVGDVVFAVGNPLGVGQTVTMGIVSAKGRSVGILDSVAGYEDFIQTDAAINQGNSGGALIDAKGRLVGINTAIISPSRGNIGIGFAIPVNLARSIMTSLIETGSVTRGYLGVSVDTLTAELAEAMDLPKDTKGVVITNLPDEGPAAKAGLKRNDVIISIDGRGVTSLQELRLIVSQKAPESEVEVKALRDGKERTVKVTLGKLADDGSASNEVLPGVSVVRVDEEARKRFRIEEGVDGLLIEDVAQNSPYFGRLGPGMVIVEVNRQAVTSATEARQALRPGRSNLFLVYFRGGYRNLILAVK